MRTATLIACAIACALSVPAGAASLSKRYSYYSINGQTSEEIETELSRRGPKLQSTGLHHPGATEMEFRTKLEFAQSSNRCRISAAHVRLKVRIILPKWRQRRRAERDLALVWDTLSSDIKRHEESHVVIAKNHARELEKKLTQIPPRNSCKEVERRADEVTNEVLARHDRAQERFDQIEGINFEKRMLRLLKYRLQQIEAGRLPG